MRLVTTTPFLTFLCLGLSHCGGTDEATETARQIVNPSAASGDDTTTTTSTNSTTLSSHLSLGVDHEQELSFPTDYQGFCQEQTNNGTITSNAQWTIQPANVAGIQLTDTNRCHPKLKILSTYSDASQASIVGTLPTTANQSLVYTFRLHLRLPPLIPSPTSPFLLNTNMPQYTGPQTNNPPFSGGPNYNGDGPKMRFCSNFNNRWFRDGNNTSNRTFGFMVEISDPSPFMPTTSDFSAPVMTCASDPGVFVNNPSCANYCPFAVELVTIGQNKYAKLSMIGALTNFMINGNSVQRFTLTNGACMSASMQGNVNLYLNITSPGGSVSKQVARIQLEDDFCNF